MGLITKNIMDLNADFTEITLTLLPDAEGENIATLVRSRHNTGYRDTVLYLHGFIDYFFQAHVAEAFHAQNMDFYALDVRKYGRALLPHQTPNYCEDVREYFEEITTSINEIKKEKPKKLFILAHSTGCITASMYLNEGEEKAAIDGLILNAPFLEMPQSRLLTQIIYYAGKVITTIKPDAKLGQRVSRVYPESIHKQYHGEWDYDLSLKPVEGFPIYLKWAMGIADAHRYLHTQSAITVPILSMFSAESSQPKTHGKAAQTTDIVLNVNDMRKISPSLGSNVTLLEIKGGIHDLFLSKKDVREATFDGMFGWLAKFN